MMTTPVENAERRDILSPIEHAEVLRRLLVTAVTEAIVETVANYSRTYPAQPWAFDARPGASGLRAAVDVLLDDLVEASALGRPVDGVVQGFPSRLVLGASADADG